MDIKKWLELPHDKRGSKYETLFVEHVLSRVSELDVLAIHAQYHFRDSDGGNRYCDFAILEGDELRIAIEVDGYDKTDSGRGMTHKEFVDWQRRHASLVAQGWAVIRFANSDVRDEAARCAEHLRLLLRSERGKQSHIRQLEGQIRKAESDLAKERISIAEERANYGTQTSEAVSLPLGEELPELRRVLQNAKDAAELSEQERARLKQLEEAQQHVTFLTNETSTMKTTIWAMTTLIALIVTLLFVSQSRPISPVVSGQVGAAMPDNESVASAPSTVSTPSTRGQNSSNSLAGTSCQEPLPWQEARNRIGATSAFAGPIARVVKSDDVKGHPTFITVGRAFPSKERLDVVIWGNRRAQFDHVLNADMRGKDACFFGEITERDGLPQMILRDREQLQLR